jgi:hypothetical protein
MDKNNPNRCYVEDFDTSGAVIALMRHDNPGAWPPNGKGAAVYVTPPDDLRDLLTHSSLHTELNGSSRRALGIVLDAETKPNSAWERVRSFAKISDPPFEQVPDEMPDAGLVIVNAEGKRLGLWIMPDNKSPGMLEDFLRFLVPDDSDLLFRHAVASVTVARNIGAKCHEVHLPKAHLHTWLAWQEPPGERIGTAISMKLLDPRRSMAAAFVAWFKLLYELD